MSEQLWRTLREGEEADSHLIDIHRHPLGGVVVPVRPVAAGALLIEDGEDAAVERMARFYYERLLPEGTPWGEWGEDTPEVRQRWIEHVRPLFAAAVGKGG